MNRGGIFARGLLMGAADIVPGVSGGTMAFITGIYDTLLDSLRSVDLHFLRKVAGGQFVDAWQHINGGFLLALLAGIATSIFSLARLISWILLHYPVPLWAFFFGLILASALTLLREIERWTVATVVALVAGTLVALFIALSPARSFDAGLAGVFLSGFLAICAMILPGISGSFILVLLGMYGAVLTAIESLDLGFLVVFAIGAAAGLMCFSRLLHWLLQRYHQPTMALLTGFLFGSLTIVWPWKEVLEWVAGRDGEPKPVQQVPVLPGDYQALTGSDPMILVCLALMATGFLIVWVIDARWGADRRRG